MKVVVSAPGVTPSGKVTVTAKLGKKTKTYRVMLNKFGRAKLRLERAKQPGKLKVQVAYAGDAAVLAGKKKVTIRVVRKQ